MPPSRGARSRGFALVTAILVMAAVAVLSVGLFTIMRYEKASVSAHVRIYRAELGVESGMQDAMQKLRQATRDDLGVIFEKKSEDGQRVILGAHRKPGAPSWEITPLRSGSWKPAKTPDLAQVETPPEGGVKVPGLPSQDIHADWVEMPGGPHDSYTVRYAWWAEDLQGRVWAGRAGNRDGEENAHRRSDLADKDAVPGLAPPHAGNDPQRLRDMALYAIDPDSGTEDEGTRGLAEAVVTHRDMAPTTGTFQALVDPEAKRDPATGRFVNPQAAALEENLATGLRPYPEAALIPPFTDGEGKLLYKNTGAPMADLNALLEKSPEDFVSTFVETVRENLPDFEAGRKGGFPEDYLATLAAEARDYADTDADPTVADNAYRGFEAYPVVSELYYRFRWEKVETKNKQKYAVYSVTPDVELWNPTNVPVEGSFELTLEANYIVKVGFNEYSFTGAPYYSAGDVKICSPLPQREGNLFWCPPVDVGDTRSILPRSNGPSGPIQPNEFRQFELPKYTFYFSGGPESIYIASPLSMLVDYSSGYRLRWKGKVVDWARAGIQRRAMSLHYPKETSRRARQQIRGSIPGHSYWGGGFVNNMGDPRMSRYIGLAQDANAFPRNGSPGRRNVRWAIYAKNTHLIYGRVKPSEWPDGGHDPLVGRPVVIPDDRRLNPDDPRFYTGLPPATPSRAPQRLSNRGSFLSASELGHLYDPVMWDVGLSKDTDTTSVLAEIGERATASPNYGGGNTLRIGRPEHPKFDRPGLQAWHLLDLFHATRVDEGVPKGFRLIDGQVNINTATRDTLRALLAGTLHQDEDAARLLREETKKWEKSLELEEFSAPTTDREADDAADAIIRHRETHGPFQSPAQLMEVRLPGGAHVFGDLEAYGYHRTELTNGSVKLGHEWNDAMAEELFARAFNGSSVRSRHFRVFVTAEVVAKKSGRVLARRARVVHLFLDPGPRGTPGPLAPGYPQAEIIYRSDL